MTDEFRKASAQLGEALMFLTLLRHTLKENEFDPQADGMFASAVLVAAQVARNAIWDAYDDLARVSDGVVTLPHHRHGDGDNCASAHEAVLVLCGWCTDWKGSGYPPDLLAPELNLSRLAALLIRERAKLDANPQAVADKSVATLPPCDLHFDTEDDLPAEFREEGKAKGAPLSREYLRQSIRWRLKGAYLSRAEELTRNAWVGRKVYHNYTQLLAARERKKERDE